MSEREEFMQAIKRMWVNMGRPEHTWDHVHDWDLYFRLGVRAKDARVAFDDALECE